MSFIEQMSDGERLASLTTEVYGYMMRYCRCLHLSFSDMLKIASEMQDIKKDWDKNDDELKNWMEEQVKTLENIFKADDVRTHFVADLLKRTGDSELSAILGEAPPSDTVH